MRIIISKSLPQQAPGGNIIHVMECGIGEVIASAEFIKALEANAIEVVNPGEDTRPLKSETIHASGKPF